MAASSNKPRKRSWAGPLFGLAGVGLMVWALVAFTQPDTNFEPYNQFKAVTASTTSTPEAPVSMEPVETTGVAPLDAAEIEQSVPKSPDDNTLLAETMDTETGIDLEKEVREARPKTPTGKDLPRQTLEHIGKGIEYSEKGMFNHADIEFEKAAQLSPNAPEVFSIWGTSMRLAEKYAGADRKFKRAHELAPNDAEITLNWGMARLFGKNADGALELFQETVQLNPDNYLAWNYMGKAYGLKKDYVNEEKSYVKSLALKEDFAQAHFNLGVVRSIQKKFEDAAPHFIRAIELDKQFEKPFVVQFLTAMGLKNKTSMKEAKLKEAGKKESEHKHADGTQHAKHEHEDAKKSEGSGHSMEGSGSNVVKTVTHLNGQVLINGEPAGPRGVIYLETTNKLKVPKQRTQHITVTQKNKQFLPGHSVVMVGSTISFKNEDFEVHNIYSKSSGNQFNLGAMSGGVTKEITFDTPGPVVLRCNMHKDMVGTLFVAPNGYAAETDAEGRFNLPLVKSQDYKMGFWHPRLFPQEVEAHMRTINLTGEDTTMKIEVTSQSTPEDIHDLVDGTDYNELVAKIETEVYGAIDHWKQGKKYSSQKRMLTAITRHYDGGGLKDAITKSFSENRSKHLEDGLDEIRKQVAGIDKSEEVTEASLKFKAKRIIAQLKNNVRELEHRLNPDKTATQ
ncbi:hypothetical protein [Nitrospina watsonii]|uniref:TPR_REGION domain-containing protein n=1 Tax=Nitrospina watsonii TaxID=1323948 RepID=A0ABM9HAV4_9BACT|nr:hypothetical protein [Nitrospina watsonii]CAI2717236.1 TPR_REGION domain-containing protein [Nitrospina watsonii]